MEQRFPASQPVEREGVWPGIFAAISDEPDVEYLIVEYLIVDSTIGRTHLEPSGR
jgi:hypothetical protein